MSRTSWSRIVWPVVVVVQAVNLLVDDVSDQDRLGMVLAFVGILLAIGGTIHQTVEYVEEKRRCSLEEARDS